MSNERLIEVTNLSRVYEDGASKVTVLESLNLSVTRGEQLAIVGASGSGKSTLLHLIGARDNFIAGRGNELYAHSTTDDIVRFYHCWPSLVWRKLCHPEKHLLQK